MSRLDRSWKVYVVLMLFLPVWWWLGLPPLWSPVDLAEHYAVEGEHTDGFPQHPSSGIDSPQESAAVGPPCIESLAPPPVVVWFPHFHVEDRPPPGCFSSSSHGLRAPPTLMLA